MYNFCAYFFCFSLVYCFLYNYNHLKIHLFPKSINRFAPYCHNYTTIVSDYDDGVKKITRYQKYFGIKNTLARLNTKTNNKYTGGVIWHTQGSGKSLTMVMLAQLIAAHPNIKNPKIILVTDRIDLDSQITETFQKCQFPVENAEVGP